MKKFFSLLLILCVISTSVNAKDFNVDKALLDTANTVFCTVTEPCASAVGGEWAVFGLNVSQDSVPDRYNELYYENLKQELISKNGILDKRKYTEYSRAVIALCAMGKNPSDVSGYNLIDYVCDFENVTKQGINGPVFALLALDMKGYGTPEIREKYLKYIMKAQRKDGGFALSENSESSEVDITAMALQALAKYCYREDVGTSCEKGLRFLLSAQTESGGFSSYGEENAESLIQVIVALCLLGISPYDVRFIKNGETLVSKLSDYYVEGEGFLHSLNGKTVNLMTTEQALYCLASVSRFEHGRRGIYGRGGFEFATRKKNNYFNISGRNSLFFMVLKRNER